MSDLSRVSRVNRVDPGALAVKVKLRFGYRKEGVPRGTFVRVEVETQHGGKKGTLGVLHGWAEYNGVDAWDAELGEKTAVNRALESRGEVGGLTEPEQEAVRDALHTFQRQERKGEWTYQGQTWYKHEGRVVGGWPEEVGFECRVWFGRPRQPKYLSYNRTTLADWLKSLEEL